MITENVGGGGGGNNKKKTFIIQENGFKKTPNWYIYFFIMVCIWFLLNLCKVGEEVIRLNDDFVLYVFQSFTSFMTFFLLELWKGT